jgi:hypothetical protein
MSRVDALPADQKAVLQLLLRQGKGYDELSGLLRIEDDAVRRRAHDALDALGPGAGGLEAARRHELADWLLGQQQPDQAAATKAFLEGSPAGRAWASAVAGELRPLGGERLPSVPANGTGAPAEAQAPAASIPATAQPPVAAGPPVAAEPPAADAARTEPSSAPGRPRVSRRGGALLIAGVLAAIAAAVVLAIVLIGGGGGKGGADTTATSTTTATQPQVRAQINLLPPSGAPAPRALGIVQVVDTNGQQAINAVAQGLPNVKKVAYGIWAYSSPSKAVLIGGFNQTDNKGHIVYQGPLQKDISGYKEIVVTRETHPNPTSPGAIYLRGKIQAANQNGG